MGVFMFKLYMFYTQVQEVITSDAEARMVLAENGKDLIGPASIKNVVYRIFADYSRERLLRLRDAHYQAIKIIEDYMSLLDDARLDISDK
jgi:hypothetical protein